MSRLGAGDFFFFFYFFVFFSCFLPLGMKPFVQDIKKKEEKKKSVCVYAGVIAHATFMPLFRLKRELCAEINMMDHVC